MEGLKISDTNLTVYIHPSMSNKVRRAILTQLSSLLFTYDEVFDGVLLAYEVHVRNKVAGILPGLVPHYGVKLRATLLLFSPKPDMLIEGKVVKLGRESIHAIVLGFSSAAIMLGEIREELKYKIKDGLECFTCKSHKPHIIKVGSIIRFVVKSMDEEILHISGSLVPPYTGCINWLSEHNLKNESQSERRGKRHLENDIENNFSHADRPINNSRSHKSMKTSKE